jgi:glutathione peroxidase
VLGAVLGSRAGAGSPCVPLAGGAGSPFDALVDAGAEVAAGSAEWGGAPSGRGLNTNQAMATAETVTTTAVKIVPGRRAFTSPAESSELAAKRGMRGAFEFESPGAGWCRGLPLRTGAVTTACMKREFSLRTLEGEPKNLSDFGKDVLLVVNVASECGYTPHYEGLEALYQKYGSRGFAVLGFPCNQFGGQEPGTAEEIRSFCTKNYSVTFPLFEKVEVNGEGPQFAALTETADSSGKAGDIAWNFEKFLIGRDGTVQRFRHRVKPNDENLVNAIEAALAKS